MRRIIRPRIVAYILLGLLSLYTLAGFFLLPYLITTYGIPAASEQLKHPIVVREVACNPFALSLRFQGLEVRESDQTPILGFEEFYINLRMTTLLLRTAGFDEIRLVMPFVSAKVNRDGKLNLLGLIPPSNSSAEAPTGPSATNSSKTMMPLEIGLLEITKGMLEYRDESKPKPVSIDIVPVQILLRNFSTVQGSENAYAFTAEIGKGEAVAWEGTISLEPVESDGKVTLSGVKVQTVYQAVQDRFQFNVLKGEFGVTGSYHFDLRGLAPRATIKDGTLSVRNLEIGERGETQPVMAIPNLDIGGIQFDLEKRSIMVGKAHSTDARFNARIEPDGTLNYRQLFLPVGSREDTTEERIPPVSQEATATQPWSMTINEIDLQNYGADFEDRTLANPAHVVVEALNLTVKDAQIPFKKPLPIVLSMTVNQTGTIGLQGQVGVEPMSATMEVSLKQIGIRPFQPYIERFLDADIREGAVDLNGTLQFAKEHPKGPLLRFLGNLSVNKLVMADQRDFEEAALWKTLALNRVVLDIEPTRVKIGEVLWQEPLLHLIVDSDGTLNLSRLLAAPSPEVGSPVKSAGEEQKQSGKQPASVAVMIDQVKLVKAAATYRDLSLVPHVKTGISDFNGTIEGLSSRQIAKAKVDLRGTVDKAAPLIVVGKINPLSEDAFTDLVITLGAMDLTPAGPYSDKFIGYGLSKGTLSLDLKYRVSQKHLEAENLVLVDQLTFGAKTDSPDATALPVPLVVALLKDRKGQIAIDLPIRGNLNDPDFKYGKVVISTLVNLLGKIVVSPFTLIGKLIPGGADEEALQFIEFPPGSAALSPNETKKLEALETALDERQGLRLDIAGTADPTRDRVALRTQKLKSQLLSMKQEEQGTDKPGQEELSLEDERRLVAELFAKLPVDQDNSVEPQPKGKKQEQPTLGTMKERLAETISLSEAELEALARQRGEVVRDYLLERGKLAPERVFMQDVITSVAGHEKVRTQLGISAAM